MSAGVVDLKQATDEELKFLDRVFAAATFTVKPGGYYDAGTEVKLIEIVYLLSSGQPCALVVGVKDGRRDEEISSFDEFDITWPDEIDP